MSATMKIIPSDSSGHCVDYLGEVGPVSVVDRMERGENNERVRVLFASGQHCRPETAKAEFRALREEHGREGEMRTVPSKYIAQDQLPDGLEPTHLKVGKNWRAAKANEAATHYRQEPLLDQEKRSEAYHYIISFAPDTVNRDDSEACRQAFEAVEAMWAQDYPGTQAKLVAHGDAKGSKDAKERGEEGKFHVHIAANAIIHSEMEVDGRTYKPGQRMAGALTNVDTMRERWDKFLETRGHEFGLEPQDRQVLPEVGSKEYRDKPRRTNQDYWENDRGQISDHDRARRGLETAFEKLAEDPSTMAKLDQNERMQRLASEVGTTGDLELKLRTQKSDGQQKIRSFMVPDRKQAIGHTKLGGRYANDGVQEQLELIAQGQWKPYERSRSGPLKPITELDDTEVAHLQRTADGLATQEAQDQALDSWLQDWAVEEGKSVEDLWAEREKTGSPEDRELAHGWKSKWEAERAAKTQREVAAQSVMEPVGYEPKAKPLESPARKRVLNPDQRIAELMMQTSLELRAAQDSLAQHLQEVRADQQDSSEASVLDVARRSGNDRLAERVAEVEEQGLAGTKQPPALSKVTSVPQPVALTVKDELLAHRESQRDTKSAGTRNRTVKEVGPLKPTEMHDRELIAVVRAEHHNGGAYVDFQLAADDPAAAGRTGLNLHAGLLDKHGRKRRRANTWQQLSRSEYAQLQLVAGDNAARIDGQDVYAVRCTVVPWGQGGSGYEPVLDLMVASRRSGLAPDLLHRQTESEDIARKQQHSATLKKIEARSALIGQSAQEVGGRTY